ncbi:acyl-CoA dehydrogenase [Allokutzneria sp. A3M-2-11 16]|uniref:acyl-CoA dehydrogenase family protein n=1 Tax=Allokutzneria sp. A3M-2-11 16 TaxID=2962043 RepID=UPI0020B6FCEE|nr:acyl-CoA dehydrogenase [Allokutzneria sp. A3M-2-11 16]MCP3801990.1 acyl-CoA dehydrogenase [Allokutzneria sp. A3M-2-11 16]
MRFSPLALTRSVVRNANDEGPLSAQAVLALDRDEEFPAEGCAILDEAGLNSLYVPPDLGGALYSYPTLVHALAQVAGYDLTLAIAHAKTFLGAAPVWLAGERAQAARLARRVLDGAVVSWGLTERGHGADLLAGELSAAWTADGWSLTGSKWMINNARRCGLICVLARTAPEGGPLGFSLLLVDTGELPLGTCERLPKLHTHGVRGADISGIAFVKAPVPHEALVGPAGTGLETTLKALQVTRTLCPALSIGTASHAVRLAQCQLGVLERYSHKAAILPVTRRVLGQVVATLWIMESVAYVAARYLHLMPEQMSVVSAIAKALVPTLADEAMESLRELMGVRGYLETDMFQKVERDNRIVAIFDGSTPVNEDALLKQLPHLSRTGRDALSESAAEAVFRLGSMGGDLPAIEWQELRLVSTAGCDLVRAVPRLVAEIRHRRTCMAFRGRLDAFEELVRRTLTQADGYVPATPTPAEDFTLARRYEVCFAGAACLAVRLGDAPVDDLWLEACLARVMECAAGSSSPFPEPDVYDEVSMDAGRLFPMAEGTSDGR